MAECQILCMCGAPAASGCVSGLAQITFFFVEYNVIIFES